MKLINLVLGAATAIILGALIALGISAFYPAPARPAYPMSLSSPTQCATGDTQCLQDQKAQVSAAQAEFNKKEQAYMNASQIYNKNLFIIANIIGLIVFAIGFFLMFGGMALAARGVPIGGMLAGLWSIIYGYGRGWGSVDDMQKFFVGLAIAVVVIGGSMWLMERHARRAAH